MASLRCALSSPRTRNVHCGRSMSALGSSTRNRLRAVRRTVPDITEVIRSRLELVTVQTSENGPGRNLELNGSRSQAALPFRQENDEEPSQPNKVADTRRDAVRDPRRSVPLVARPSSLGLGVPNRANDVACPRATADWRGSPAKHLAPYSFWVYMLLGQFELLRCFVFLSLLQEQCSPVVENVRISRIEFGRLFVLGNGFIELSLNS